MKIRNKLEIRLGRTTYILLFIVITCSYFVFALPVPHGVEGIIYELDGITQVRKGIDFYVHNIDEGHIVSGKTGHGSSGRYSVALKGNDGDQVILKAWNKYNQANISFSLDGMMYHVNLLLNMTYPPIKPNITSYPITNATEGQTYSYDVEAFDENEDVLEYSLIVSPENMNINQSEGLITWIPAQEDIGNISVVVEVSDGDLTDQQEFTIYVYENSDEEDDDDKENGNPNSNEEHEKNNKKDSSGGGGGGSSFNKQLAEGKLKQGNKKVKLKIKELKERPKNIQKISRRVYKYLSIEDLSNADAEEISIDFKVDLKWLSERGLRDHDIVLSRYTKEGWKDLETRDVKKDAKFVYYIAKTPGLSYFAITVKEGVFVDEEIEYSSSNIKEPFHISGIFYDSNSRQVEEGTKFWIENVENNEVVSGKTGIGPNTGGFAVIMYGEEGDELKIQIENADKIFTERLKENRNLDLIIKKKKGLFGMTGAAILENISIDKGIMRVSVLIVIIILSLIFIRFKYNEDD